MVTLFASTTMDVTILAKHFQQDTRTKSFSTTKPPSLNNTWSLTILVAAIFLLAPFLTSGSSAAAPTFATLNASLHEAFGM